ncbi:MAG TPA: choice-of-anchor tandem repeat GloVer-containing protein [Terriglobia bacterium]|nr:choice-of-anchor tandem repeat GloVer-containing protein [Terriglobia bacterium]
MTTSTRPRILVTAALALALGAATARAQTYTDIYNFDGTLGSSPDNPQLLAQGRDGNLYGSTPYGGTAGDGAVFVITPSGGLRDIHSFAGGDGLRPKGGLTLGSDGNFYGSTVLGGAGALGTVFKVTPAGTLTVLYSFTGGTDGAYPYAPPVQGIDGNFYGTTQDATAYKITPTGVFTLLGTVPGPCYSPLTQGTDGNFYGTTPSGGKYGYGTVFKMTPAGNVTIVYSFDLDDGAAPNGLVTQGNDGNFYGTTTLGGTADGGVAFKLTPAGTLTVLHNFVPGLTDGSIPVAGPVYATDGNVYGITSAGGNVGSGYGVIFKTTTSGSYSVLYNLDNTHGRGAVSTPMQHTNGTIYGLTISGGTRNDGVVYSFALGIKPFVKLIFSSGKVGMSVQILGGGLTGTTAVTFNGTPASFHVVSNTYLTAMVPAGATTGFVKVTTPKTTLTSSTKFRVTPSILSFMPPSGPVGTLVTINGSGLKQTSKVTFGGVAATSFTVNSDTQVTATVPTGAKTGKIAITTPGGTAISTGTFTVT